MVVCKIQKIQKLVAVPIKFIYKLDFAKSLNNRLLMFWSSDFKKEPNFDLPISQRFEHNIDSCFDVKFLRAFGKYD